MAVGREEDLDLELRRQSRQVDGQEAEFGDGQNWVDRNLKLNCGPRQLLSERPVVSSGGKTGSGKTLCI